MKHFIIGLLSLFGVLFMINIFNIAQVEINFSIGVVIGIISSLLTIIGSVFFEVGKEDK